MFLEMNREFRGPPSGYETMKPATEKKCEFDFLASNGAMPNAVRKLDDNTENKVGENLILAIIAVVSV